MTIGTLEKKLLIGVTIGERMIKNTCIQNMHHLTGIQEI